MINHRCSQIYRDRTRQVNSFRKLIVDFTDRSSHQDFRIEPDLVVSGINLAALKGREVQVGEAVLRFTVICAPCSRMEEALGKGGYSAVRGHGGWCAEVVRPGRVRLGDVVQPVD